MTIHKSNGNSQPELDTSDVVAPTAAYHPIRLKALDVHLSDGQRVLVHEPSMKDMGTFLRALPAMISIQKAFQSAMLAEGGVVGAVVDIPDMAYEGIFPLLAVMTQITVEEFISMPLYDGLAIMRGLIEFAPKQANPPKAASATTNSPS